MSRSRNSVFGLVILLSLAGCADQEAPAVAQQAAPVVEVDFETQLQLQLLQAKPGDIIEIPAGTYSLYRGLSLSVDGVTIRGAGMDKTILSFKEQVSGAEGLLVTANDFTIEDLAIEDAKGDALKINEAKNVIIRRVRTEWTNGPDTANGAYGIYPVQTENTLIDEVVAIGASDAGIYVGQSKNVVVRNSRAEYNVAGIEIENTLDADVFDNVAINNTGGILVFNMPNLSQEGARTRIFRNLVHNNNTENFAAPGGAVAGVLGAYMMLHPRRQMLVLVLRTIPVRLHVGLVLVIWIAFQVGAAFWYDHNGGSDTAWWAHVGGFVAGMVLIRWFKRREVPLFDRDIQSDV